MSINEVRSTWQRKHVTSTFAYSSTGFFFFKQKTAYEIPEFAKSLEAFERQPGLGLVGVVHPYQGARFSGRAGAEMSPLEQQDASNSASGKVICGAGPVRTTAHHDHDGAPRHGNHAQCYVGRSLLC